MILLNPGPVTLSPGVRSAMPGPDWCHREDEFGDLQSDLRGSLLAVHDLDPAEWEATLISGSGTSAVEAMISSLVGKNETLVVVENGVYGERMRRMAETHGIEVIPVHHDWIEPIDAARVEQTLASCPGPAVIATVHHETTTGRLNDLGPLTELAARHEARLLVDAVSSFGAEHIDFEPPVAAIAATANKCLHGAPGVSFVLFRRDQLERDDYRARSVYLDLKTHTSAQQKGSTAFTPALPAFFGLEAALEEFFSGGGVSARWETFSERADFVQDVLLQLGVEPFIPPDQSSVVLRSYRLPAGLGYDVLHDGLKERGFVIYAGQGGLSEQMFRISTMGHISDDDLQRLKQAFTEVIKG